ncbi:hypothetical protein HYH02_010771 [Chlamydomonas schloesseri]|uniref:ERD4-related membrane protein n=1 Tax=Chlamydomonas schloesseri TaxID=2026947 RepID=A0A835TEN5_9CHLO|nr:hypothetical protein HYH02_010771 [Chlamydomonas schloesseri]|eukprot:KAG2438979.1 hypothetical protein HYH02_010771 [Chlamydomonas schloesseri]
MAEPAPATFAANPELSSRSYASVEPGSSSGSVGNIIGINNNVSQESIVTGLWISTIIGVSVIFLFCFLQRSSQLYRYRLVTPNVRAPPPPLQTSGVASLLDWAAKAIAVSDLDLVQSAGLDALIMVKLCSLGVQLFLPMAILGVCVLIPLHWTGGEAANTNAQHSDFMRLTMANIMLRSKRFWVHFVFIYVYLGWAMLLLRWHYHQYLTIRQHYLRKGDANLNVWRTLYHDNPRGVGKEKALSDAERVRGFLANVPLIKALLPTGVNVDADATEMGVRAPSATSSDDDGDDTFAAAPGDAACTSPTGTRPSPTRILAPTHSRLHVGAGGLGGLSGKRPAALIAGTHGTSVTGLDSMGPLSSQPPETPARRVHSKFPWHTHGAVGDRLADEQLLKKLPPPSYLTRMGSRRIAHADRTMLWGPSEPLSAAAGASGHARRRASATAGQVGGLSRNSMPTAVSGNLEEALAADASAGAAGESPSRGAGHGSVEGGPSRRRVQRNSQSVGPRMLAGAWSADGGMVSAPNATAGPGVGAGAEVGAAAGVSSGGVDGWLASARKLVAQGALGGGGGGGGGYSSSKGPGLATVQSGKESEGANSTGQPVAEADEYGAAGADPAAAAAPVAATAAGTGVCSDADAEAHTSEVRLEMLPEDPVAVAGSGTRARRRSSATGTGRHGSASSRHDSAAAGLDAAATLPVFTSAGDNAAVIVDLEAGHGAKQGNTGNSARTVGDGDGGDGVSRGAVRRTQSSALTAPSGPSMTRSSVGGSSDSSLDFLRWWEPPERVRAALSADVSRRQAASRRGASRSGHASGGETSNDEGVVLGVPLRVLGVHRSKTEDELEGDGNDWTGAQVKAEAGPDEYVVSRSRPSVSYRKTVNAVYPDGTWEAVLAQHYAVLVTDVKELPPRKHKATNKKTDAVAVTDEAHEPEADAGAQDAASKGAESSGSAVVNDAASRQASSVHPKPKHLRSFLPSCLVSWCTFGYGTQAANRWLGGIGSGRGGGAAGSVAGSEESFTRINPPSSNGTMHHAITFGTGPNGFHSRNSSLGSPAHRRISSPGTNGAAPPGGHRRTRSGGSVGGGIGGAATGFACGSFGSGGAGVGAGAYGIAHAAQHLGPGAVGAATGPGGQGTPRQLSQQHLQQAAAQGSQRGLTAAAAASAAAAAAAAAGAVASHAEVGVPLPALALPSIEEQSSLPVSPNGTGGGEPPTIGASGPVITEHVALTRHRRTPSAPRSADIAAGDGVPLSQLHAVTAAGSSEGRPMPRVASAGSLTASAAAAAAASGSIGIAASGKSPSVTGVGYAAVAAASRTARFGSSKPKFLQLLEQMGEHARVQQQQQQDQRPGSADPAARSRASPQTLASLVPTVGQPSAPSSRASSGRGMAGGAAEAVRSSSLNGTGGGGSAVSPEPHAAPAPPAASRFGPPGAHGSARGAGPVAEAAEAELELEPVSAAASTRPNGAKDADASAGAGGLAASETLALTAQEEDDTAGTEAGGAAAGTAAAASSRAVSGSSAQFKDAVSHISSLRRRRAAGDDANDGAEDGADGVSRASGSSVAHTRRTIGSDASGSGRSRSSSQAAADASARARARWDFVREAIIDGRVAELPYRMRYSVVSATFARMFPDEFDRAIPVINHKEVDLLLMQADNHMAQYEYAKAWERHNQGQKLEGRTGFLGLTGDKVRLKHYHLQQVKDIMKKVQEARRRAFDTAHTPSWFVFFRTQRAAAVAAQCVLHAEDNRQFRVHPAPGPEEVNWSALWSDYRSRDLRRNLTRPLTMLVVLFPIGIFTGGLMQLDYLLCPEHKCESLKETDPTAWEEQCKNAIEKQITWEWYCLQTDPVSQLLRRLVIGWLPSLLINLWQGMVLPLVFTLVVQASRQARSLSEADRAVAKYMFYFGIFNVFLGGVVGSTIIQGVNSAINSGPGEIFKLVGNYLPTSSNFFIQYCMFRALVAVPLRMLWPHIGIRMYLLRRYLRLRCWTTLREKAFLMAPVSPRYGFEVGMVLLIFLIAFAFAVVSPILLPMALLFFAMAWLFWRWALLYVYVRKYEGGGTMWPFIFARVMVCMAIFPLFTACVFVTKEAYIQAILLFVTVPPILIRFNSFCYYRYEVGLRASIPLEAAVSGPHARVDPWVYMPPPLLTQLAGWYPDWPKAWQGWNMPVMYV